MDLAASMGHSPVLDLFLGAQETNGNTLEEYALIQALIENDLNLI